MQPFPAFQVAVYVSDNSWSHESCDAVRQPLSFLGHTGPWCKAWDLLSTRWCPGSCSNLAGASQWEGTGGKKKKRETSRMSRGCCFSVLMMCHFFKNLIQAKWRSPLPPGMGKNNWDRVTTPHCSATSTILPKDDFFFFLYCFSNSPRYSW